MLEPVFIHFSVAELTHTDTGLPNDPDGVAWTNIVKLVADVLEPAREIVGPLHVNSCYRSAEVNKKVGGVPTSQHLKGLAADVVPMHAGLDRAFEAIKQSSIPFDQLIIEPTWIHISAAAYGDNPRRQCLRAHYHDGHMVYEGA